MHSFLWLSLETIRLNPFITDLKLGGEQNPHQSSGISFIWLFFKKIVFTAVFIILATGILARVPLLHDVEQLVQCNSP